jgi:ATP-dependent helicase/nuclease subunit A
VSLTAEQAQAVFADGSVAVVAGAGTGKTHMLTNRYLHHLGQGLSPLEIVAVTFTDRAAAELKARVRRAVQRADNIDEDALVELEAAQISTLHALAARICRDHPDLAEVPPDFGVLDDLERPVWLAEQLEAAFTALPEAVFGVVPYTRLKMVLGPLLAEPYLAAAAFAYGPEGWPPLVEGERSAAVQQLISDPAWREARATVEAYAGLADDLIEAARQHALRGLKALEQGRLDEAFAHFAAIKRNGGSAKKWPYGGLTEVKAALGVVQELIKACRKEGLILLELGEADETLASLLPTLKEAFEVAQSVIAAAKRRARVLDFADLELHALKALAHAEVREHYRKRWRVFLIDEFQDTNPVQAELLERLTECAVVTLVGDEKQAIYGFRGAEAGVFQRYRARLNATGGCTVQLSESFRTHAELVSAFNTAFAPVLERSHQDLKAWRTDAPHAGPHLTLQAVEADKGVLKPQRRLAEARAVGEAVRRYVEEGVLVHDRETNALRPIAWDDVAVLTRTWEPLNAFNEVFAAMGIPAVHTGGGSLLKTREAKDGLAFIRFLADPHDDLALAVLLRGPFFALDDRSLYTLVQGLGEDESWWDGLQRQHDSFPGSVLATLHALVANRRKAAPSRLLQRADYLTGYTAVIANLPGAARRLADWSGFLELVRRLEGGLADAFAVSRRLRRLQQADIEVPRPPLGADGAVSLTTIHRAKGLEWPLVILADLDYAPPNTVSEVLVDRELGVTLRFEDEDGTVSEPALYTILKERLKRRETEEAKRVLYVGLTRARDRVVLTATQAKGGGLDLLAPGLDDLGVVCGSIPYDPVTSLLPNLPPPEPPFELPGEAVPLWSLSPSALGAHAQYVTAKDFVAETPPTETESWNEVLLLVGEMDESWVPLVQALREAGLPAPHPDTVFRELTERGAVSPYPAVCMWPVASGMLAVIDAATPDRDFEQTLVRIDPTEPTESVVELLQRTLGNVAGVPV